MFDTAFHQTMPPKAYTYALPQQLCEEHHLRRYGAHGTSYRYLVKKAAQVRHTGASSALSLMLDTRCASQQEQPLSKLTRSAMQDEKCTELHSKLHVLELVALGL